MWCLALARELPGGEVRSKLSFGDSIMQYQRVLEDVSVVKIGFNINGFDRHALANHGITIQNTVDLLDLSRFLNSANDYGHSLKDWCRRLGLVHEEYSNVAAIPQYSKQDPSKRLKRDKIVSLKDLWQQRPDLMLRIRQYITRDVEYPLKIFRYMLEQCQNTKLSGTST